MYDFIVGKVDRIAGNTVVLENNGIGYLIYCPLNDLAEISHQIGKSVKLYLHFIHKEDSMMFYGFLKGETREGFRLLLKVSGIGPRTALNMLSRFGIDMIAEYVQNENVDILKKIPGIGEKTARKIILDLKGSLKMSEVAFSSEGDQNLIQAMVAMGYSESDVFKIYDKGRPYTGVFSDDIKKLLKLMV